MPSFDIVSKVPWNEVDNALNQAQKELAQRYDFKDTATEIEKTDAGLTIRSTSEDRANAALDVLQEKLIKRKVGLKFFDVQEQIQDAQVRVTGKNRDDLQKAMALVRGLDMDIELSFMNFRD
jgi:uncharacterized protein YajQ (UPF0234 family)